MNCKSAAAIAACAVALASGAFFAWPQYEAWRTRAAAPVGQMQAESAESAAKAMAEPALRAAVVAWGQVHLGVNAFISGTFSVSAGPERFACGTVARRPDQQATRVIVAPDGSVQQVEGAEAKRQFLARCNVVLL